MNPAPWRGIFLFTCILFMGITSKQSPIIENQIFSILLPSWNNLPYLQLCIRSIKAHSDLAHQIIVVINEGKDGTLDWVKSQEDLTYIYSEENLGICIGLNEAAKLAQTDYLLYINDDMYVLPHWDKILWDTIQQIGHTKFMLSATMIEPSDTGNPCAAVQDYGNSIETFQEDKLLEQFAEIKKQDWNGSTWPPNVMHKSLWNKVGGMSEEFSPGMYSDPDLSMKLWQAGVRYFKGVGESKVYHFGSRSTKRLTKNVGREIFLKKWKITSGTFTKYYLRRGQLFEGELKEAQVPLFVKLKNYLKYLQVR